MRTLGGDATIDRRLGEALIEPCLQLARNSVAHGIEPPVIRPILSPAEVTAMQAVAVEPAVLSYLRKLIRAAEALLACSR